MIVKEKLGTSTLKLRLTDFVVSQKYPVITLLYEQKPIVANPPEQIYLIGEVEDGPEDEYEGEEQEEARELGNENADDTDDGDAKLKKGMEACNVKLPLRLAQVRRKTT